MTKATAPLKVGRAEAGQIAAAIDVARHALGWREDDPNLELFRWKHEESPFGPSPLWIATDEGRVVGVRALMRWEFEDGQGRVLRAVRAVDTATLPAYQGRGIFKSLTLHAVDEMTRDGVDFVFNTPNDQSRPGYLKMGWVEVGRVPVAVRPSSIGALRRMAKARVPAAKWSLATRAGQPALALLDDDKALATLIDALPAPRGLRTRRTPAFLRWRYAGGPVCYRALALDDDPARGLVLFRLRDRGGAVEATVTDVLLPSQAPRGAFGRLLRRIVDEARPDYLIAAAGRSAEAVARRMIPAPSLGPTLTWRALARSEEPRMGDLDLVLGDIELF